MINTTNLETEFSGKNVFIQRKIYDQNILNTECDYNENLASKHKSDKKSFTIKKCINKFVPITKWLSHYSVKNDLLPDIIAGFTVAIMHIPQGMAYALLGNVPPIVGLYSAFFPVLAYILFGSSKHNSMGTFAIITIMVGKVVTKYSNTPSDYANGPLKYSLETFNSTPFSSEIELDPEFVYYSPIKVASTVGFVVGIMQLVMFIFKFGSISSLLSNSLVSGLTTGGAVHVLTSQVKDIFGLTILSNPGFFEVINTYIEIFKNIHYINLIAAGLSFSTMIILIFNNEILKKLAAKLCSFPIPAELALVLVGTIVSKAFQVRSHSVMTLEHIPTGFPEPSLPNMNLALDILLDCLPIAIISFTFTISMAVTFSRKLNYDVDSNQELFAMGTGNLFGSFFSCMPFAASLSRSIIQQEVGGKTQLASFVSCGILTIILLWIGPFFEDLPKCVLAGIIIVSLKGMLWQVKDVKKFFKESKFDGALWIMTFLSVVLIGIDVGMMVGILLSLISILIKSLKPQAYLLGNLPNTDLYLDIGRYKNIKEIPFIKIFHFNGIVNFASKESFKTLLCTLLKLDLRKSLKRVRKNKPLDLVYKLVIWDLSSLNYIDATGVVFLKSLIDDFQELGIQTYIVGLSCANYDTFIKFGLIENEKSIKILPTVHDAVEFYNSKSILNYVKLELLI